MRSVNHCTPREKCTVNYRDLDFTVQAYLQLCDELVQEQTQLLQEKKPERRHLKRKWKAKFNNHKRIKPVIFAGKSDLKSAFHILGLSSKSWQWLIMKAQNPSTGEWMYFVDKRLPFGASISCTHFQCFSDVLCHIVEFRLKVNRKITNYLDDFLFLARSIQRCNFMIRTFLNICEELGVPVSMDKTEWGTQIIVFLGILLNGVSLTLSIPLEKKAHAINLLQEMLESKKTTVKHLQKLCVYLNFLCKAIVPGRPFMRRMYAKYSHVVGHPEEMSSKVRSYDFKLKQNHHIRLDKEFKLDCEMWIQFLSGNLEEVVCCPMTDFRHSNITDIKFYSDTSASEKHWGFGALMNNSVWLQVDWEKDFIQRRKPSIKYLELFALCAGILTWCDQMPILNNREICIYCDNQAVMQMVNNTTSSCKNCMVLIRMLVLNNVRYNRKIQVHYVDTKSNFLADALSRGQMKCFWNLAPGSMQRESTHISSEIWPVTKIWIT